MKTTLPSVGSYYIRPKAKGQSFSLYLKRYEKGKPVKPHEKIDPAIYYRFGISADMTATDAKIKLDEFRKLNKASRLDVARQDRAFKRYKARTINQGRFPPKTLYTSIEQMQADLDAYMEKYNTKRTNQGKRCLGRTPKQTWGNGYELYKKYVIDKTEVTVEAVVH